MKYVIIATILALGLSSCAGEDGAPGPTGPGYTPPSLTTEEEQVKILLGEENDYRLGQGQTVLTTGLACTLYTTTSGDRIQASIPGHDTLAGLVSVGAFLLTSEFNQPNAPVSDGLNVLPANLRPLYINGFLLRCQGKLVVTQTGWHVFEMSSDDAGLLYVAGAKTIDLDNAHGMLTLSAMKYMRKGVYDFRVDFAQTGGGSQALIVKMDGQVVAPLLYAH